jgi:Glycosyl hydrolases family 25
MTDTLVANAAAAAAAPPDRWLIADTSEHNGNVPMWALHEAGIRGVINRASIGTQADDWYPHNTAEAGKMGLAQFSYHYLWPDVDPVAQAVKFVACANGSPGYCDVEQPGLTYAEVVAFENKAAALMQQAFLGTYTNYQSWHNMLRNPNGDVLPGELWLAQWVVGHLQVSAFPRNLPFPNPRFGGWGVPRLWQMGIGILNGHSYDVSVFHGTQAQLNSLGHVPVVRPRGGWDPANGVKASNLLADQAIAVVKAIKKPTASWFGGAADQGWNLTLKAIIDDIDSDRIGG